MPASIAREGFRHVPAARPKPLTGTAEKLESLRLIHPMAGGEASRLFALKLYRTPVQPQHGGIVQRDDVIPAAHNQVR